MTPAPANDRDLARALMAQCRRLGFALAGVCDAAPSDRAPELHQWLAEGRHGSMQWLAEKADLRLDPRPLLHDARECVEPDSGAGKRIDARTILVVADLYQARGEGAAAEPLTPGHARIARYARGGDYHEIMKRRLHALCDELRAAFPDERFRAFVDTAPVLEREHAARAALGWIGKHTLLIHPRFGSYLLLGGVLMSLEVVPVQRRKPVADHCGTCTRCIDACPTQAITPYSVDATRCISYLTIERRAMIDPALHGGIGDWVFGCDICQEVCPHNSPRPRLERSQTGEANPEYLSERASLPLLDILGWSADDRAAALRGTPMKRATLDMWRRNAVIAAGNTLRRCDDPALREAISRIAADEAEPALVRDTARDVLAALRGAARPSAG